MIIILTDFLKIRRLYFYSLTYYVQYFSFLFRANWKMIIFLLPKAFFFFLLFLAVLPDVMWISHFCMCSLPHWADSSIVPLKVLCCGGYLLPLNWKIVLLDGDLGWLFFLQYFKDVILVLLFLFLMINLS